MLTFLVLPKPFKGHIGIIQRNALRSWQQLRPQCEILLFGDEEGTREVARDLNITHVPDIMRNEHRTPLLSDVFRKGEQLAAHDLLCYINGDIILGNDFLPAVKTVCCFNPKFLMVGECWNVDIKDLIAFRDANWENDLKTLARRTGKPRGSRAIDYFVFPRGLYADIPPFAVGRAWFDNWLVGRAGALNAAVVDATRVVTAIHQNHDYAHVPGGVLYTTRGQEATQNLQLAGGIRFCSTISEAAYRLGPSGIRRNPGSYVSWEKKMQAQEMFQRLLGVTKPLRRPFGLNIHNVRKFRALVSRQR